MTNDEFNNKVAVMAKMIAMQVGEAYSAASFDEELIAQATKNTEVRIKIIAQEYAAEQVAAFAEEIKKVEIVVSGDGNRMYDEKIPLGDFYAEEVDEVLKRYTAES